MKRLLFLFLLFPFAAFAQKTASANTDRITVVNKNTAYANFIDTKLMLTKAEVPIADLDKDYFQLKTGNIAIEKEGITAYFVFDCRDDKISITGMWKLDAKDYAKIDSNSAKAAFDKMVELAKKLGSKLVYEGK